MFNGGTFSQMELRPVKANMSTIKTTWTTWMKVEMIELNLISCMMKQTLIKMKMLWKWNFVAMIIAGVTKTKKQLLMDHQLRLNTWAATEIIKKKVEDLQLNGYQEV